MVSRRHFLRGAIAAPLVAISATSAYARLVEPYDYRVTNLDIFLKGLPPAFDGFRIAQVSDVHHSRIVSLGEVHQVMALARSTQPDLFALTGDYTTAYRKYIEPCAEALGTLHAPHGTWAVLGNHDHYTDPELTDRALRRAKINVLNNASTVLTRGSDRLQLAGIDDWSWGRADWTEALKGLDPGLPTILLSHQPRVLEAGESAQVSLILSGHTHGGQINLPFVGPPARFAVKDLKYAHGLFRSGETQLYVTSGTGVIGMPVRLGVPPEVSVLRLRRAQS